MVSQLVPHIKLTVLTIAALLAFAGNSVLCRLALSHRDIDPASFTLVRLFSGAATLLIIYGIRRRTSAASILRHGNRRAAFLLFCYAIFFSTAYTLLETGTGALILFASVQMTMIAKSLLDGEGLSSLEWVGAAIAFAGFVFLVTPGVSSPPLAGFALMTLAGISWGFYTLAGKLSVDALGDTASNFIKATPLALLCLLVWPVETHWSSRGLMLSCLSGALTSGVGYSLWYEVLPQLKTVQAAVAQLTVPFIAAGGGILLASEQISLRFLIAAALVSAGIWIVIKGKVRESASKS